MNHTDDTHIYISCLHTLDYHASVMSLRCLSAVTESHARECLRECKVCLSLALDHVGDDVARGECLFSATVKASLEKIRSIKQHVVVAEESVQRMASFYDEDATNSLAAVTKIRKVVARINQTDTVHWSKPCEKQA